MTDLSTFNELTRELHSETISVIRRTVRDMPFDLAVTNGRTRVWSERFDEIEPEFLAWCDRLGPNDVLWDIGASIGHFSIYAALHSGATVYGFEPEAQNFSHASLNHYLNYEQLAGRFTPLNFGLAPRTQLADFYIRLYGAGGHTKSVVPSESGYSTRILLLTLAEVSRLGIAKPSAIKIDVDGSEKIVIEAIEPLLAEVSTLFIELPRAEMDRYRDIFGRYGLECAATYPVIKLSGGHYDEITNAVFDRKFE